jgi:hypothetical protein
MKVKYIFIAALFLLQNFVYGQNNLFPQIDGWKIEVDKLVYDSSNLWNIIDGAADLFLEYSFIDLHTARFTNTAGIEIKAELYKHSSPLTAFGMYSQEKDPEYKFIKLGTQGYIEPGAINFLDGSYYVKLSSNQSGDAVQKSLQLIAEKIALNLKQEVQLPVILQKFPEEQKQANSEQYVAQNFLGYSFLKSAFTATYKSSQSFKAFIIETDNQEAAGSILDKYIQIIPKSNLIKTGDNFYDINDPNNGQIYIALKDRYVYGVINCSEKETGIKLLEGITNNLAGK